MKPLRPSLARIEDFLGRRISPAQHDQLERFAVWLVEEAASLGGIGPDETDRIWDRHVLDSLLFAHDIVAGDLVLDVGSGVGLPGIPVAIVHTAGTVTLLDRSGRRIDALHRIRSILSLDVHIVHADVVTWQQSADRVLFRASLPLPAARSQVPRLCAPAGGATFGLGRGEAPAALKAWRAAEPSATIDETLIQVPAGVLDSPVWLLRMTPL